MHIVFRVDGVDLVMTVAGMLAVRGHDEALLAVRERPAGWFNVGKVDEVDLAIATEFDFNKKCLKSIIVNIVCWIGADLSKIRILRFAD